jgi:hypothetical protein
MATKEKIAVPLEGVPSIVLLNNGERMTRKDALAKGWKIHGDPEVSTPGSENAEILKAHKAWRTSVLALPEARDRESAAVEIVMTQTANTMSVASARAFLRGLPTEQTKEETTVTTNTDPNAARKAEIANSMSAFNKNNGYRGNARAASPSAALASTDPAKLKRLAEIRLGALTHRMERGEIAIAQEQKKLVYALSVHEQTGLPLATVFAQLGVDTAKMLA